MKQKNLYIMCGAPGCGKSTWINNRLKISDGIRISRDVIRFAMVNEGDDYFSQEDEVFMEFLRQIQTAIRDEAGPKEIYVDATHLTEKARNRVLNQLDIKNCTLIYVWFDVSLEVCLERNKQRTGRSLVPDGAVRRMYDSQRKPSKWEKYQHELIIVNEKGEESNE